MISLALVLPLIIICSIAAEVLRRQHAKAKMQAQSQSNLPPATAISSITAVSSTQEHDLQSPADPYYVRKTQFGWLASQMQIITGRQDRYA